MIKDLHFTWQYRVRVSGEEREPEDWPHFDKLKDAEEFAQAAANVGGGPALIYAILTDVTPMSPGGSC